MLSGSHEGCSRRIRTDSRWQSTDSQNKVTCYIIVFVLSHMGSLINLGGSQRVCIAEILCGICFLRHRKKSVTTTNAPIPQNAIAAV